MPHEIPDRWREHVRRHVLETAGEDRDYLTARDFWTSQGVRAVFPDGSEARFRYAFFLADEALREAAVFTEHCGYHYFPLGELRIELVHESHVPASGPGAGELLARVADRDSFLRFVRALSAEGERGSWAHDHAREFLDAAAAWAEDAGPGALADPPSWRSFAEFLYAGALYE